MMESTEQKIFSVAEAGMNFGFSRIQYLLEKMNHPEREIRVIHIGGTNGKGSTLNFLQNILTQHGYCVGTFSSPSIICFYDQIKVNEEMITEEELQEIFQQIFPIITEMKTKPVGGPTQFEIMTLLAILYFARVRQTDYCIFEVGMGGEKDATNIVQPILTLLTTVSLEHTQYLGHSVAEIAVQKAGIIKEKIPVLTTVRDTEALVVLKAAADQKNAELIQVPVPLTCLTKAGDLQFTVQLAEPFCGPFELQMLGAHQAQNAALALYAFRWLAKLDSIVCEKEKIVRGLYNAQWPGRMEKRNFPLEMILDGSHNAEGIEKLCQALRLHFPNKKLIFLFSASADKDVSEMLHQLRRLSDRIDITTFSYFRSLDEESARVLAAVHGLTYVSDWRAWIQSLRLDADELLVITGSLYFISEVRKALPLSKEGEEQR